MAQHNLGLFYLDGIGCIKNPVLAERFVRKAAEQEYGPAQYTLATMYEEGKGFAKDLGQARFWYEKAVFQYIENAKIKVRLLKSLRDGN